ncbi:MAG: hypothetical protein CMF96_09730 [Candidatus Marinimicrobia bacterium]|nr:hypothetical protein [Candidatus Neomarinimicrobiota bacterium]
MSGKTLQFKDHQNIIKNRIYSALELSKKLKKETIVSHTFRIDAIDILPMLTHPADRHLTRVYLEKPSNGFSMAGMGSTIKIDFNGDIQKFNDEISDIKKRIVYEKGQDYPLPSFLGGHAFNPEMVADETWRNFPRGRFVLPECLATQNDDGAWLTISTLVNQNDNLPMLISRFVNLCIHYENRMPVTLPPISSLAVDKFKDVPDNDSYSDTINKILERLKPGKVEKVVLSRSHHVKISENFSVISGMQVLRNAYPKCMSFFFSFPNEGIFFGSTPESLIRLKNKSIETEALAGTISRGKNMEEDRLLAEKLRYSHKECEEHRFVLEQILRKLKPITNQLDFSDYPEILKLKNVQHLKTPIFGKLESKQHILNIVKQLHPTPAVAGTPTSDAMSIIQKLETHDRGWYSGPLGWADVNGDGEFFVGLRSALVSDNTAHVYAGGGIVAESIAEREWDETKLKIQPIITALSGGQI